MRIAKALTIGAIVSVAIAVPLAAQQSPGFAFPPRIGAAELVGTQDFEAQNPGLGQVGQYRFQGWRMSVYLYDRKRTDIAETANPGQSTAELDEAVKEVFAAQKLGHYAHVEEGTSFVIPPLGGPHAFSCRSLKITTKAKDGQQAKPQEAYESYRCVTTARRKFVKLVLSSETPAGDQATVFTPVAAAIELTGRRLMK